MNETCPNCPHPPHGSQHCTVEETYYNRYHSRWDDTETCLCYASKPTNLTRLAEAKELLQEILWTPGFPMDGSMCGSCDLLGNSEPEGSGEHKGNCIKTRVVRYLSIEWLP